MDAAVQRLHAQDAPRRHSAQRQGRPGINLRGARLNQHKALARLRHADRELVMLGQPASRMQHGVPAPTHDASGVAPAIETKPSRVAVIKEHDDGGTPGVVQLG